MTSETRKLLAYFYMESATSEDFIDWAIRMLELGYDSKSLGMLASLTGEPLYPSVVEDYLKRSFSDLNWRYPSREESLRLYAFDIADGISSEIIFPEKGCCEMSKICEVLGNPQDLEEWRTLDVAIHIIEEDNGGYGGEIDGVIIQEAKRYKHSFNPVQ